MKTKSFLAGIVVLALSVMLPSCGAIQGPDTWTVEIEDSYRAQIALGFDYLVYDKDAVDELANQIDDAAEKQYDAHLLDENVAKYKLALEQMAPNNAGAAELLQVYNSLEVKFSEWTKQEDIEGFSVWTANEENTGIKVIFKNNSAMEWDLELDEETFVAYMEKVATHMGAKNAIDEDEIEDAISKRIEAQYEDRMPDDKIMSKTFYSIFKKAQDADDSELGWPDWDYWEWTQGAYAAISSIEVDVISEQNATAHIVLSYPERADEHVTKLDMPMVFENNNWYVDDIIHYEDDGSKYSLKKAAGGE